jgi:CBS domain-containing protein
MQREVTVRDVMDDAYVGVNESDGLVETGELMLSDGSPVAVVLEGSDVVGGLTAEDVLGFVVGGGDPASARVGDAMTGTVRTIRPERSFTEARDRMVSGSTGWLVVTDGDEALGLVTESDLLAGSTLGSNPTADPSSETDETDSAGTAGRTEARTEDTFEDQGICEVCGSLTHDLASFNGQLRCADCRTV